MIASLIGIAIKALSDSLLSSLAAFIQSEMHDRGLLAQGAATQAAAETAASAKIAIAEAQAEAQGPSNISDAIYRAKTGTI